MRKMYFIGVTTGKSSINSIFPQWMKALKVYDACLTGVDFEPGDDPENYRAIVRKIKDDPDSLGALVTTHKMDIFSSCHDIFDFLDPLSQSMGEIASIYKCNGQLCGRAVDPVNCGRALNSFLPSSHWKRTSPRPEACILGAGGASLALCWHFLTQCSGDFSGPNRLTVCDISPERLEHLRRYLESLESGVCVDYQLVADAGDSDLLVNSLPSGSLVVNATGLGKDRPGSPISNAAVFPEQGLVWEFNYRGDLVFLEQAQSQRMSRKLQIEDGWMYFVYGWSSVIGDVFNIDMSEERVEELGAIAAPYRSEG